MTRHPALPSVAMAFAAAMLLACSGDSPLVAPHPTGPSLDEAGEVIESVVLHPSAAVHRRRGAAEGDVTIMSAAVAGTEPFVRVGVADSANGVVMGDGSSTLYLGGTHGWTLADRATGIALMSGNGGSVRVTLEAVPETYFRLQVMCAPAANVAARRDAAEALGHTTMIEYYAPANCTRLFIGQFAKNASWSVRNTYRNQLIAQGLAAGDSFWKLVTFGSAIYRVHRASGSFDNLNPVMVTSAPEGHVTIGTSPTQFRRYRGVAYAHMTGAGTIAGVNELPMEEYLYGVVPRELGPLAFPEFEAQKAQAVAARTYAMVGLGKRNSDGYDLRATTSDQVYGGYQDEYALSTAAVDATAGVVATYNGSMISTLYSSTTGGHTADSEEAYSTVVPYLRGVPDAQRGEAFEHVPSLEVFRAHANPLALRSTSEGDFESDWSPRYHRWTFEWTAEEIRAALADWSGAPVKKVLAINVLERGPSGRALKVEYVTEDDTLTEVKDRIRSSLRYVNANGNFTSLPSTLFFVEPVRENGRLTGGFRVYGGGWGHGVGLSQTGAVGMAQKGHSFEEILKHYYQGIALEARY